MNNNKVPIILTIAKLFSELQHIKISALRVYFNGFYSKKTKPQLKINAYKKLVVSGYIVTFR